MICQKIIMSYNHIYFNSFYMLIRNIDSLNRFSGKIFTVRKNMVTSYLLFYSHCVYIYDNNCAMALT